MHIACAATPAKSSFDDARTGSSSVSTTTFTITTTTTTLPYALLHANMHIDRCAITAIFSSAPSVRYKSARAGGMHVLFREQ